MTALAELSGILPEQGGEFPGMGFVASQALSFGRGGMLDLALQKPVMAIQAEFLGGFGQKLGLDRIVGAVAIVAASILEGRVDEFARSHCPVAGVAECRNRRR
jgi:hypothetical protein